MIRPAGQTITFTGPNAIADAEALKAEEGVRVEITTRQPRKAVVRFRVPCVIESQAAQLTRALRTAQEESNRLCRP